MDEDYEIALRLQKQFDEEGPRSPLQSEDVAEGVKDEDLAQRLQAEYDAEVKDDSEDCLVISDAFSSGGITSNAASGFTNKSQKYKDTDFELALQLQNEWQASNLPNMTVNSGILQKKRPNCEDSDLALALQLQNEFQVEDKKAVQESHNNKPIHNGSHNIVDASWELVDPCPDIYALFMEFNAAYFWGQLEGVEVRWSPRMTLCAGLCVYQGRGGYCSVRLSKPLLKLRPRKDLVETLLHEMIHAYLFVTQNNKDHDGHGPEFHKHMYRINKLTGTNISVFHSFYQEVALYKQHWWRCTGVCKDRKPFYGWVKRSMNRAPSANDRWWAEHEKTCGGTFVKIRSPEPDITQKGVKRKATDPIKSTAKAPPGTRDIRTIFSPPPSQSKSTGNGSSSRNPSHNVVSRPQPKDKAKPTSVTRDIRSLFPPSPTKTQGSPSENKENPPPNFQGVSQGKVGSKSRDIRTIFSPTASERSGGDVSPGKGSGSPGKSKTHVFPGKGNVLGKF